MHLTFNEGYNSSNLLGGTKFNIMNKDWHQFETEYYNSESKSYIKQIRLFTPNLNMKSIDLSVDWRFKEVIDSKGIIIRKQSNYLGLIK